MQPGDRTVRVTTMGRGKAEDRRLRTRRYLISQGIRLACVLLAVLLPVAPFWKIALIAGSIVLPWLGVVAANAGPTVERRRSSAVVATPAVAVPITAIEPTRVIDAD
jgi:uncharacterized membrane protein